MKSVRTLARVAALVLAAAAVLTACGEAEDAVSDATEAVEDAANDAADAADATTDAAGDAAEEAVDAVEDAAGDAAEAVEDVAEEAVEEVADVASDAVEVSLVEWELIAPTSFAGGDVTFTASNDGEFPHELAVVRGDSYETLPLLANGAVDEAALGADFLGRTDRIEAGASGDLTLTLEPGNYVLVCNIQAGPNSHAAAGQVLSVTVEG